MSFLGNMVTKALVNKAEEIAVMGVAGHLERTRSVDALVNKSAADYMLFIKAKEFSIRRGFTVRDEFGDIKYNVKSESPLFGKPSVLLLDVNKDEIARVKLESKSGLHRYGFYLDGYKLGDVTPKFSFKLKADLAFNGWHFEANLLQSDFKVTDKDGNVIIKFSSAYSAADTYVLEMNNRENEIMGLLLIMFVELIHIINE